MIPFVFLTTTRAQFSETAALLLASQITVYPIDARGIQTTAVSVKRAATNRRLVSATDHPGKPSANSTLRLITPRQRARWMILRAKPAGRRSSAMT